MRIKLRSKDGSKELEFSSDDWQIAIQMSELELDQIKSMDARPDADSPSGNPYRTFGLAESCGDAGEFSEWALS